jgi:hypothetical protein
MKFLNNIDVNSNNVIYENTLTASAGISVSSTDPAELYRFPIADYLAAKFIVTVNTASDSSIRELLAIHDGTDGFITEYALVSTDLETVDDEFKVDVSGSNAVLTITPSTTTARNVNVYVVLIK